MHKMGFELQRLHVKSKVNRDLPPTIYFKVIYTIYTFKLEVQAANRAKF